MTHLPSNVSLILQVQNERDNQQSRLFIFIPNERPFRSSMEVIEFSLEIAPHTNRTSTRNRGTNIGPLCLSGDLITARAIPAIQLRHPSAIPGSLQHNQRSQ